MSNKGKLLIFIVLLLLSFSLAGSGFYLFQKQRAQNIALREELEDIKTKQKITEIKLQESQKTISNLELKLKDAKTQIDALTSNLEREKSIKQEALVQIEQIRFDLEQQKELRQDLEKKFSQAQEEARKVQAQLKELESKKLELEKKIEDLQAKKQGVQGVELGKIIVSPETEGKSTPKRALPLELEGKVLVVNKDYDFLVINLGSKDGVEIEDEFLVYHDNKYLGEVKVEKVHDSMSAAGFTPGEIKDKIAEGDKVVRKTK